MAYFQDLLENYVIAKMRFNALYGMSRDYRQQLDSLESQIIENLRLEPLSEKELDKIIKMLRGIK